jgi:hypothetical protein
MQIPPGQPQQQFSNGNSLQGYTGSKNGRIYRYESISSFLQLMRERVGKVMHGMLNADAVITV